ncbi:MAG: UDP-N-acetylmuramoyl-tripeptide--D-alanyl-D-alanine ligase [Candidatus Latescibacteria bacterium]|nr:UDP-N-acetylmuramoyl-tripeptide--D-alanyl-D-alanine ligase [Candidatus Latescibacterota bacterium]
MEGVSLREIQEWTQAEVVGKLDGVLQPSGVSTDSRTINPGELFLALRGAQVDGHQFVAQALARGACAALVEEQMPGAGAQLKVPSVMESLGTLARRYRQRFELPVIAVVGSAGKTTTKEMIAAVLRQRYRVLQTPGNENNELGVPRTILQLAREHEVMVVELAARKVGDIRYLCEVVQPNVGVLLNIGTAHLEIFGSVERVAKAKGELLEYLDESSLVLVNADDCVVAKEVKRTKGRLLGFSLVRESHYCGEGLVLDQEGCGLLSLHNFPLRLQIPGRHNVYNALAAAAVGHQLGVPWPQIGRALAEFEPVAMRSQILRKRGISVINDSYNANPGSMLAAIEMLGGMAGGRRIAVLGDMLELGAEAPQFHAAAGRQAAAQHLDLVLGIGPLSVHLVEAARRAGLAERAQHFSTKRELAAHLRSSLQENDLVLVKASRGMGLEEIAAAIVN